MMLLYLGFIIKISLFWIHTVKSMSVINKHTYFMDNGEAENEVADLIAAKSYIPDERDLPKATVIKNVDNDATYFLSKLSDEQLMKLLSEQPKKNEYYLSDIINLTVGNRPKEENKVMANMGHDKSNIILNNIFEAQSKPKNRFSTIGINDKAQPAYFRLENKEIDSFNINNEANYAAMQKLNSLLNSRLPRDDKSEEDEEKKELLFDVLVAQLKALCCKRSAKKRRKQQYKYVNQFISRNPLTKPLTSDLKSQFPNEYMFLILNEEIKGNGSDELISVDPESLEKNSSVLLLGPITTPLSDNQLKVVMTRITNELSKSEYIPLLQQLSEGANSNGNVGLLKSVLNGSQTRRYIKPHRCNHQSKLARVYGGPKWLICTGYLNLNTPSLYD